MHAHPASTTPRSGAGYSTMLVPSPDCNFVNMVVTFHLIVAALVDTMIMSLVFGR